MLSFTLPFRRQSHFLEVPFFFFFLNKESFWIVGCRDCCWASWAAFRVALLFGSPDAMEGGKGKGREEI